MKRYILLALLLLVFVPSALAEVDQTHVYDGMGRAYQQDYQPTISENTMRVVLPLLAEGFTGDIVAELIPADIQSTPIKLSNKLTQTVQPRNYKFSGKTVRAYKIDFKLALHASRLKGEYPFAIVVQNGETERRFDYVLRINSGNANDAPPEVVIESFKADDLIVGGDGMLSMTITNRSTSREARDILLTVADSTGDILPRGSNAMQLDDLLPGASVPVAIPVQALYKAAAQDHALEFTLSFTYADNKPATRTEKHTVRVNQDVRLEHTEANLPEKVTQGENVQFNLTLMNMGKGVINNALLTFDVPQMAAGGSVLAGNIEPGKSQAATANLRVDGEFEGDTSGTLKLTWEDGYGKPFSKTLPLSTLLIKKAPPPTGALSATGEEQKPQSMPIREIAAWSAAALMAILLIFSRATQSRRIRKLEERNL